MTVKGVKRRRGWTVAVDGDVRTHFSVQPMYWGPGQALHAFCGLCGLTYVPFEGDKRPITVPDSTEYCANCTKQLSQVDGMGWATRANAERRKAEALARVGGIRQGWVSRAQEMVEDYARTHEHFFSDDWWEWAGERGLGEPIEARSFGAVVQWAIRKGLIVHSDETRQSARSNNSRRPVYRSLVFEEAK